MLGQVISGRKYWGDGTEVAGQQFDYAFDEIGNRPATEVFTYDADGNLTQDGRWTYTWDGENRLIEMKRDTDTPAGARLRLVFECDHQGRRIRKQYYTYSGGWQEQTDVSFLYDLAGQAGGWNVMGELNANASNARLRTYVWGLNLSGTLEGAGGVGGLLKVTDYTSGTTHHFVAYWQRGQICIVDVCAWTHARRRCS